MRDVTPHANLADSMQVVLEGGMVIYYPDENETVILKAVDCHVVPGGKMHSCISPQKSVVLVVIGHRAGTGPLNSVS